MWWIPSFERLPSISFRSVVLFADATCSKKDDLNVLSQILGWCLLVGIFLAFIPQVCFFFKKNFSFFKKSFFFFSSETKQKILKMRRGTSGLSPLYVTLSAFNGLCLFAAELFVHFSKNFGCCKTTWTPNECLDGLLLLFQLGAAFTGQMTVLVVYLIKTEPDNKRLTRICFASMMLSVVVIMSVGFGLVAKTTEDIVNE